MPYGGPKCIIVPNFVQIGQGVAEIWPFSFFSRWRPSAISDVKKLEILTAHTLLRFKMRHRTEFCTDRSTRCGDMAIFDFSRWRPSAILDFQKFAILTACTLRGAKMRHHAKFCLNRSRRCGDMAIFDFFEDGGRPPSWIFKSL